MNIQKNNQNTERENYKSRNANFQQILKILNFSINNSNQRNSHENSL